LQEITILSLRSTIVSHTWFWASTGEGVGGQPIRTTRN